MNYPIQIDSLSEEFKSSLPNSNDIQFSKTTGWFIGRFILPEDVLEQATIGAQEFYNGILDLALPNTENRIVNDSQDEGKTIRNNEFVTLQSLKLRQLGFHPLITGTACRLAESSGIRFFADSLINKMPSKDTHPGVVGWHSDKAYWPTCSSENMLTAWIPLQDCTLEMGTLTYISESHEWRHEEELKSFYSFNNQNLDQFDEYITRIKPQHEKTPMLLKRGQVCFHNCNTIHCSGPNKSGQNRLALAIHLQDAENRYRTVYDQNQKPITISYDDLCRKDSEGNPDYSDPGVFPTLIVE
ncbi:MAG: phytanoyl-CoA dioxygenase family protein [Marinoscillum sp.]